MLFCIWNKKYFVQQEQWRHGVGSRRQRLYKVLVQKSRAEVASTAIYGLKHTEEIARSRVNGFSISHATSCQLQMMTIATAFALPLLLVLSCTCSPSGAFVKFVGWGQHLWRWWWTRWSEPAEPEVNSATSISN